MSKQVGDFLIFCDLLAMFIKSATNCKRVSAWEKGLSKTKEFANIFYFVSIIVINLQHMATLTEMKKNIALRKKCDISKNKQLH